MSKKPSRIPPAPTHLMAKTKRWWVKVVEEYDLSASDLSVLEVAAVQWDRLTTARETLAKSELGALAKDRFGQLREHPAVAIEQNSTRLFLAAVRQLGLDLEPSSEPGRLPNPTGRHSRD
jgi:P27 family predicted phage terminase small subunit